MGIFDAQTEYYFRKTSMGEEMFFPYGSSGYGYLLSAETAARARSAIKTYTRISLVLLAVSSSIFLILPVFVGIILFAAYHIMLRLLLKGATKTTEKISPSEARSNMARSLDKGGCLLLATGCVLMALLSITAMLLGMNKALGMLGIVFFGYCFWNSLQMFMHVSKQANPNHN